MVATYVENNQNSTDTSPRTDLISITLCGQGQSLACFLNRVGLSLDRGGHCLDMHDHSSNKGNLKFVCIPWTRAIVISIGVNMGSDSFDKNDCNSINPWIRLNNIVIKFQL